MVSSTPQSTSCASAVVRLTSTADRAVRGTASLVSAWVGTELGSTDQFSQDELGRPDVSAPFTLAPGASSTVTVSACAVTQPPADSSDAQFVLSRPTAAFTNDTGS